MTTNTTTTRRRRAPSWNPAVTPGVTVRLSELTLHVSDSAPQPTGGAISQPLTAADIAQRLIGDRAAESVLAILLDARHRPIHVATIATGTLNAARLLPRDVYVPALMANAAAVIVAHNHPSGDPSPSSADRSVKQSLESAGNLLGVPLLDFIIVTATTDAYWSAKIEASGAD